MREFTVLLLADTHLGFDDPVHPRVERRRRGPDFAANYRRVLEEAARERPQMVVHGGDVFFRSRVPQGIVERGYEPLLDLAESGVPVFIVPGNHDRSRMPARLWLAAPNIHVFDRPGTFHLRAAGATVAVAGFPFVRRAGERFRSTLRATGWSPRQADVSILCMHQTVEGATAGTSGYRFPAGRDVIAEASLPTSFTGILSGHMHRHQVLGGRRPGAHAPVIYPGSTERTSFAERYERKGSVYLTIGFTRRDGWRLREWQFRELPTRPMIDLDVGALGTATDLERYLRRSAARLDPQAVVRLTSSRAPSRAVIGTLSAPFLRRVFPESMNIQLSVEIRELSKERVGVAS